MKNFCLIFGSIDRYFFVPNKNFNQIDFSIKYIFFEQGMKINLNTKTIRIFCFGASNHRALTKALGYVKNIEWKYYVHYIFRSGFSGYNCIFFLFYLKCTLYTPKLFLLFFLPCFSKCECFIVFMPKFYYCFSYFYLYYVHTNVKLFIPLFFFRSFGYKYF